MSDTTAKASRPDGIPRVRLRLPEAPTILHILGSSRQGETVTRRLEKLAAGGRFTLRAAGPDKWLVLAAASEAARLAAELGETLAGSASVLDQSDGRVLIELSGSEAREALAKGTGVDLDPSVFPEGRSVMTAFGHITIHLTRAAADAYELIVMRSFAESLWESLHAAAREFGCDAPEMFPEPA